MNAIFQIRDDAIYTIMGLSNENINGLLCAMMRKAYRDVYQIGYYHRNDKRMLLYNELTTKKMIDLYRKNVKVDLNSILYRVINNDELHEYVISLFDDIEFIDQNLFINKYVEELVRHGRVDLAMPLIVNKPEMINSALIGMILSKKSKYVNCIKEYSQAEIINAEIYNDAIYAAFDVKWDEILKYLITNRIELIDPEVIITCAIGNNDPELLELINYEVTDIDIRCIISNMVPDISCFKRLIEFIYLYDHITALERIRLFIYVMERAANKDLKLFKYVEDKLSLIIDIIHYNELLRMACEEVADYIMPKITNVESAIISNIRFDNITFVKLMSKDGYLNPSIDLLHLISIAEGQYNLLIIALFIDIMHNDGLRLYNDSDKIIAKENLTHYNLYSAADLTIAYTRFICVLIYHCENEHLKYTLDILRRRISIVYDHVIHNRDCFLNDTYYRPFI